MRVGIAALLHESNTFIAEPTTLDHFRQSVLCAGEDVRAAMADTHHEVGGFFEALDADEAVEVVPLIAARAVPYGAVSAEAMSAIMEMLAEQLDRAGPLDGILAAPHGATVCESHPDADGYWLGDLRARVGSIPIVASLDAHANLSPEMVEPCNAIVAYRSNPHLDQRERGREAARLLLRTLRGEIAPVTRAAYPPLAINIERQLTSDPHLTPLYELADRQLQEHPSLLSNSILLGFPYADVVEMGSAVLAVTDGDVELAESCCQELADYMWTHRDDFVGQMIDIPTAIETAYSVNGPVCLLDMGDNVGGGSPADSTHLAHALSAGKRGRAFLCLYDPTAQSLARSAGKGATVTLTMGGKTDSLHGQPLTAAVEVVGLYDGRFHETEPRHGGFTHCDQGLTAVVRTDCGLTIMLTSQRMPPFSIRQLTTFGVDPADFEILVAKGVNAPVAAYEPVCSQLIRVNTPGCTTADMTQLPFEHRRRPLFPFE